MGRVNPGGLKIVGLKFSWVVASCPKRFFVKKKIGRVNHCGEDDSPPENRRVRIVLGCC